MLAVTRLCKAPFLSCIGNKSSTAMQHTGNLMNPDGHACYLVTAKTVLQTMY